MKLVYITSNSFLCQIRILILKIHGVKCVGANYKLSLQNRKKIIKRCDAILLSKNTRTAMVQQDLEFAGQINKPLYLTAKAILYDMSSKQKLNNRAKILKILNKDK